MSGVPALLRSKLLQLAIGFAAGAATYVAVDQTAMPSPEVQLAIEIGAHYESSGRHIGKPYIDKLGKGQPLTVCNGITGAGVVAGRYYTPADCYRLEVGRYKEAEAFLAKSVPTYSAANVFQQAVGLDFIHNKGAGAFSTSTYRRKWVAGDTVGACRENERWNRGTVRGVSVVLPGLKIRADANSDLCANGL